jgi:CubicO group peptidase (beta-lactamase class C family)
VALDTECARVPVPSAEYSWGGACHSNYWVDPAERLVVVYFTQVIPAGNLDDHGKMRALVYQAPGIGPWNRL